MISQTTTTKTAAEVNAEKIENYMAQCNGCDHHTRHGFNRSMIYTSGVEFVAETAGAFWLIDAIASHCSKTKLMQDRRLRDFQIWSLKTNLKKKTAVLECLADDGEKPVVCQRIPFTDFCLPELKMYVERGGNVDERTGEVKPHLCLMLKCER
jgi:hypothetical protein